MKQFCYRLCIAAILAVWSEVWPGTELAAREMTSDDTELLAFFHRLYEETPPDAPERLYVNKAVSPEAFFWRKIVGGRFEVGEIELETARRELRFIREQIRMGRRWPFRKREEFRIPFARESLTFGVPWKEGLVLKNEFALSSCEEIADGVEWRVFWNREALFLEAKVPDIALQAIPYDENANRFPWQGDCIEVFVMPDPRLKLYWELVVNPANDTFTGLHCNDTRGWFVYRIAKQMAGWKTFAAPAEGGYLIQMKIPFAELPNYMLGNQPEPGAAFYFALVRIDGGVPYSARPLLYDGHNVFGYFRGILDGAKQ